MWLFSLEFPTRGPQDEKTKNRSCRNQAAVSQGCRRPIPTRGNRRGARADEVERFGRAVLVPVQSIVGDRGPLDPPDTESVFLKLRGYGEIQSSLGLSKPLLAARLKKMVRLGVLKKVPSGKSARVHEYLLTEKGRQLYPVLLTLAQWGNALAEEEAQPPINEDVLCGGRAQRSK